MNFEKEAQRIWNAMTDDFMKPRSGCDKILERELRDLWEPVLDNWCIADAVHPVSQAPEAENGYLNGTGLPRSRILGVDGEVVITEAGRFRLGKVLDNYEFHWPDARMRVLRCYFR